MSKKFKTQASSARAASTYGSSTSFGSSTFQTSSLSYITELPDLHTISDPNVVVCLRNLGKKDSTTKTKALEDLQELLIKSSVEDGALEAWINLYPRTAIDNSRRVRQLAHSLQGSLTSSTGKRILPFLPKVIGSWLAGLYDSDKIVSRAAQDSLSSAFQSEEKRKSIWKIYQDVILLYAEDAILIQTSKTLSDERNTSADDAEAKFVRVAGTGIYVLNQVIRRNLPDSPTKSGGNFHDNVSELLRKKQLWDYASHRDPYLRRSICDLALGCTEDYQKLDWSIISTCFVVKGLATSQLGSSRQFLDALLSLTSFQDSIWTTLYSSKTTAVKRLTRFLENGSQRGTEDFWKNIDTLLRRIPISLWSSETNPQEIGIQGCSSLLEALKRGITNPDEPRYNQTTAWSCYVRISFWAIHQLRQAKDQETIFENFVSPLLVQYVMNNPQQQSWSLPTPSALQIIFDAISQISGTDGISLFQLVWSSIADQLSSSMGLSLPSTSVDYAKSQEALISQSSRYQRLKSNIAGQAPGDGSESFLSVINTCDIQLLESAVSLLKSRNGKPYGVAGVLRDIVLQPSFNNENAALSGFIQKHSSSLLESPSATYLIPVVLKLDQLIDITEPLIRASKVNENSERALFLLLCTITENDLEKDKGLQDLLFDAREKGIDDPLARKMTTATLQNDNLKFSDFRARILEQLYYNLSIDSTPNIQSSSMRYLLEILDDPKITQNLVSMSFKEKLLPKLLFLADSQENNISDAANVLLSKFKQQAFSKDKSDQTTVNIIESQLSGNDAPIAIFTLIDLALDILQRIPNKSISPENLLPSEEQWKKALHPHMSNPRPLSLSISSPLQGSLYFVQSEEIRSPAFVRDADDFSLLFRIALYVTRILSITEVIRHMDHDRIQALYEFYPIALQLVNEKLTMGHANNIWLEGPEEVLEEASNMLSQGFSLIQLWLNDDYTTATQISFAEEWLNKTPQTEGTGIYTYLLGLGFTDIILRVIETNGFTVITEKLHPYLSMLRRSSNLIQSTSILNVLRDNLVDSTEGRKLINELIVDATELDSENRSSEILRPLVLLNVLLNYNEEPLNSIPSQRVVFLMQSLMRLLSGSLREVSITSEIMKLLCTVLPAIDDIYGDHWERILEIILQLLDRDRDLVNELPIIHSCLRLYNRLKKLGSLNDVNDDLLDALTASQTKFDETLIQCLQEFGKIDLETDQPRQITTELLSRLLVPVKLKQDIDIYQLLKSKDQAVQNASYGLLHRAIPGRQEQISLDMVLDRTMPQLPIGLLTLTHNNSGTWQDKVTSDSNFRSYLLSWKLIFDHFTQASHKLREAYAYHIKETDALSTLLNHICDIIRIFSGRPLDASKLDIQGFELEESQSDHNQLQDLTVHLYYCCLLYLPTLTKGWFIEQKNRIKYPLESWTQKFISPSIIIESLSTVTQWAATQDEDDTPVSIKASPKGSEVVASIAIDPESPPAVISITLPGSYPLESPSVASRTRVGVSEKNWQSWLRTIQIIIFSTGNIIEGLIAFRRNIQGALKGQSECAICYSIIGTDMQKPDKRCGTCKNTFHGSCLFKWFKSSNSSSCPLCRNNFNYA